MLISHYLNNMLIIVSSGRFYEKLEKETFGRTSKNKIWYDQASCVNHLYSSTRLCGRKANGEEWIDTSRGVGLKKTCDSVSRKIP